MEVDKLVQLSPCSCESGEVPLQSASGRPLATAVAQYRPYSKLRQKSASVKLDVPHFLMALLAPWCAKGNARSVVFAGDHAT